MTPTRQALVAELRRLIETQLPPDRPWSRYKRIDIVYTLLEEAGYSVDGDWAFLVPLTPSEGVAQSTPAPTPTAAAEQPNT